MDDIIRLRSLRHKAFRSLLCCLIMALLLFIVNNENILTDGTDERNYLRKKYNEL